MTKLDHVKAILAVKENKASFMWRIEQMFPTRDSRYQIIKKAYELAKDGFRDIKRVEGAWYFEHARALPLIMIDHLGIQDHELICAGFLHDHPEDLRFWSMERIEEYFGEGIASLVEWVTKWPLDRFNGSKEERNRVYLERFEHAGPREATLKLTDRLHNLITSKCMPVESIKREIVETRKYYLPLAKKYSILYEELCKAVEELEEFLKNPKQEKNEKQQALVNEALRIARNPEEINSCSKEDLEDILKILKTEHREFTSDMQTGFKDSEYRDCLDAIILIETRRREFKNQDK